MVEVSVVIPFYGEHAGRFSLRAVTAAWLAQDVSCEVVVATAGNLHLSVAPDLDADRRVRVIAADAAATAPGRLRNVGVRQARGSLIYLSDSDVAPIGGNYLARVIARSADRAVFGQPWMYRLPASGPDTPGPVRGVGAFCFVRPDLEGSLRADPDERITWKRMDHGGVALDTPTVYMPPWLTPDPADKRNWRAPFHWGGLLLPREVFADVGGYCESYSGWGCEDDDLLVKVAARRHLVRGWQVDPSITCLHFEHPYPYHGTTERVANSALYARRLAGGVTAMAAEDLAVLG